MVLLKEGKSCIDDNSDRTCVCSLGVCNWGLELSGQGAKMKVMVE